MVKAYLCLKYFLLTRTLWNLVVLIKVCHNILHTPIYIKVEKLDAIDLFNSIQKVGYQRSSLESIKHSLPNGGICYIKV